VQGTSSGAPSSTRNVSSILLRTADGGCLVDAGEGTCRQLAAAGVPADHLRWCGATQGPTCTSGPTEGRLDQCSTSSAGNLEWSAISLVTRAQRCVRA